MYKTYKSQGSAPSLLCIKTTLFYGNYAAQVSGALFNVPAPETNLYYMVSQKRDGSSIVNSPVLVLAGRRAVTKKEYTPNTRIVHGPSAGPESH